MNLCALDLKKAFDKMNHFGLYVKLMDRMILNCFLSLIEHWFSICATCVRFGGYLSCFVSSQVRSNKTRRGAVSPFLCCAHRRLNKETSSFELWLHRPIGMCKRYTLMIL